MEYFVAVDLERYGEIFFATNQYGHYAVLHPSLLIKGTGQRFVAAKKWAETLNFFYKRPACVVDRAGRKIRNPRKEPDVFEPMEF